MAKTLRMIDKTELVAERLVVIWFCCWFTGAIFARQLFATGLLIIRFNKSHREVAFFILILCVYYCLMKPLGYFEE